MRYVKYNCIQINVDFAILAFHLQLIMLFLRPKVKVFLKVGVKVTHTLQISLNVYYFCNTEFP